MHGGDAKTQTVKLLTTMGVLWSVGGRLPLEADDAERLYDPLVETEEVLAPGPGTTGVDGWPGAANVLNVGLLTERERGSDARTLTAVVLTSQGVVDDGAEPLEVDEALVVYEVLVEENGVLVPAASTYYPDQWRDPRGEVAVLVPYGTSAADADPRL